MGDTAKDICTHAATLLNCELEDFAPLSGGDLSAVFAISLADGRQAVVKAGPRPQTEADMLKAIAGTGAAAPQVYAADNDVLVLEKLEERGGAGSAWGKIGEETRKLHAAVSDHGQYGWPQDFGFASVKIDNAPLADWPEFWATRRMMPFCPHLPSSIARRVESLAGRLSERLPAKPVASLLHGDLWAGNVLVGANRAYFIDPACYYGDREVDLSMLQLFASPAAAFHEAYGPLEPGHAARLPIYSLWPALVHFRLFGSGYLPMVDGFLKRSGV